MKITEVEPILLRGAGTYGSTASGDEASDNGDDLNCENLGATLLQLGGIDPETHLPGVQVVDALLR